MSSRELSEDDLKQWYNERVDHVRCVVNDALAALEEQRNLEDAEAVKAMVRGLYLPFQLLLGALEYKYPNVIFDGETGEVVELEDLINDENDSEPGPRGT
jgi:hypothetical protein